MYANPFFFGSLPLHYLQPPATPALYQKSVNSDHTVTLFKEDWTLEWTLRSDFSKLESEGISKNGKNIICRS